MKRPVLLFCLCNCAGIICTYYLNLNKWQLFIICAAAFLFCLFLYRKGRTVACGCLIFALVGAVNCCRLNSRVYTGDSCSGRVESFEGVVEKCQVKESYTALTVDIGDENVLVRLDAAGDFKVYSYVGKRIRFAGEVSKPTGMRNPGTFDYARYLKARGIGTIVSVSRYRIETVKTVNPAANMLSRWKGRFYEKLSGISDKTEFSVIAGLLFGEKNYMEEDLYSDYRNIGIAHILSVSGLHVSLLYEAVMKLLGNKRNVKTSAAAEVILLMYVVLSSYSVSVIRASFMISLRLLAFHCDRRYDPVSAASLCTLVFSAVNPYYIFDSGFQLSFAAAYSMGVILPWMQLKLVETADKRRSELLYGVGKLLVPTLSVQMGMIPLIRYHFFNLSLIALIINPVAVALAGLILPWGLLLFVFQIAAEGVGLCGEFYETVYFGAASVPVAFCRFLNLMSTELSKLPGSYIKICAWPLGTVVLYYGLVFFFFSETRYILSRTENEKALALCFAAVMLISSVLPRSLGLTDSPLPWKYNESLVSFMDVGQGDCIHIQAAGKNILLDGGGSFTVNTASYFIEPYLLKNGVSKIDLALVSHMDRDHSLGLKQLSKIMKVDCFGFPDLYEGSAEIEGFESERKLYLKAGDVINLADNVYIKVLLPLENQLYSEDSNRNCLAAMLCDGDFKVFFAADLDEAMEELLLSTYSAAELQADVIKIAHHGSAGSSSAAFIKTVNPAFAAISCGLGNSYGHPAGRVIDLLQNSGIIIGRTDLNGALSLKKVKSGYFTVKYCSGREKIKVQRK